MRGRRTAQTLKLVLNMRRYLLGLALSPLLAACALQPTYRLPPLKIAGAWSSAPVAPSEPIRMEREGWWTLLGDPAVDQLVAAGLADNPTLADAAARVDQARAALATQDAARRPGVAANAGLTRSRDHAGEGMVSQTSGSVGASLTWELDLWGRVRQSALAARSRLTGADADADAARLSIISEIADTALALRACDRVLGIRDRDIASREMEMGATRARLNAGTLPAVAVATATSNLSSARTDRIAQEETCLRLVHALSALSGLDIPTVRRLLPQEVRASSTASDAVAAETSPLAQPPAFAPALPATVLLAHPLVIAAEREAAARWSEIAVARAERLPRVDLAAALSQQWLRTLGSTTSYVARSAQIGVTAPVFDGGAGAAKVSGAEASYRQAVAQLDLTVRTAARDVEDALSAQQSAQARIETSQEALSAARFTLQANIARWRAGSIAQVELEESRRQFNRAQESAITAAADRARAWVALVRTTGAPRQTRQAAPIAGANS